MSRPRLGARGKGGALWTGWLVGGLAVLGMAPVHLEAQIPERGEVRQIVSLSFVPGTAAEARTVFEEFAVPLYRRDTDMLSFRGYSEVESSVPLDLIVISAFRGMSGMDASNEFLGRSGIGEFYGRVGPLLSSHTDQFVEILPDLGQGDPSAGARTVLIWYRIVPGGQDGFEQALADIAVPYEAASGIPSQTGRFLLGDGWHYLRLLSLPNLGAYQAYRRGLEAVEGYPAMGDRVEATREVIVRSVPTLSVR